MRPSSTPRKQSHDADLPRSSSWLFGGFWLLIFIAAISASGSWEISHAMLFIGVGVLMLLFPPKVALPKSWLIFAGLFLLFSAGAFLPVSWFGMPQWRNNLGNLGVDTGAQVVVHGRQAFEYYLVFAITLLTGLWFAGHRATGDQSRIWALAFSAGVAFFAVFAFIRGTTNFAGTFGFFPNRNHTGTYLAMGALCGLGSILQAVRDKKFPTAGIAIVVTGICFWALFDWSISRAGILLISIGTVLWFSLLGRRYLGKNGLWIVGLIALLAAGVFLLSETRVKQRISQTVEKAAVIADYSQSAPEGEKELSLNDLDLRIPIALDTLNLIKDHPLTGIGARQFGYVFPQYSDLSAVANNHSIIHPESDWLWVASEGGIAAAVALLTLTGLAFFKGFRAVFHSRDRALRSACLIGAMLVPVHGIFDVPGHRIELACASIFLYVLGVSGTRTDRSSTTFHHYRFVGLTIAIAGIFLAIGSTRKDPQLRAVTRERAAPILLGLLEEDRMLQENAQNTGEFTIPPKEGDPLLEALRLLDEVNRKLPLDSYFWHMRGFIAMGFSDGVLEADRAFFVERFLLPKWVECPMRQSQLWSSVDPARTKYLWEETLRRARWMDENHPKSRWSEEILLKRMQKISKSKPGLESLFSEITGHQ